MNRTGSSRAKTASMFGRVLGYSTKRVPRDTSEAARMEVAVQEVHCLVLAQEIA